MIAAILLILAFVAFLLEIADRPKGRATSWVPVGLALWVASALVAKYFH